MCHTLSLLGARCWPCSERAPALASPPHMSECPWATFQCTIHWRQNSKTAQQPVHHVLMQHMLLLLPHHAFQQAGFAGAGARLARMLKDRYTTLLASVAAASAGRVEAASAAGKADAHCGACMPRPCQWRCWQQRCSQPCPQTCQALTLQCQTAGLQSGQATGPAAPQAEQQTVCWCWGLCTALPLLHPAPALAAG